jgi:hypothetical protein
MEGMTAAGQPGAPLPGQGRHGGILGHPGLLAAGAAGCASAVSALWAFRGLPLGTPLLWLAPLPLLLAGLGFGTLSAGVAAALAAALVWLTSVGDLPALAYLALFGVPAPLIVAGALRGAAAAGQLGLSGPLLVLGLWPVVVLLLAAFALAGDGAGGLDAAMRRGVEGALARMGAAPASEAFLGTMVRVKAAALGFWWGIALLANGAAAQALLARSGLARAASPDWARAAALPRWYPLLPGLAALVLLLAPGGSDAVPLSALLILLVPLFLLGLAGVHARVRGRPWRRAALVALYLATVLFLQMMAPALVGLGLFDYFRRRGQGGRPTPSQT